MRQHEPTVGRLTRFTTSSLRVIANDNKNVDYGTTVKVASRSTQRGNRSQEAAARPDLGRTWLSAWSHRADSSKGHGLHMDQLLRRRGTVGPIVPRPFRSRDVIGRGGASETFEPIGSLLSMGGVKNSSRQNILRGASSRRSQMRHTNITPKSHRRCQRLILHPRPKDSCIGSEVASCLELDYPLTEHRHWA